MSEEKNTNDITVAAAAAALVVGAIIYCWKNINSDCTSMPEIDEDETVTPLSPNDFVENYEATLMSLKSIQIHAENIEFLNILGIKKNIGDTLTLSEVENGYKKTSINCHPDKNGGSNKKFNTLVEAKEAIERYFDTKTIDKAQERLNQARRIATIDDENKQIKIEIDQMKHNMFNQDERIENLRNKVKSQKEMK